MKIAVTGNIGCGKSTVCKWLEANLQGYAHASVDEVVRSLYADTGYLQALQSRFGTCERKALSDIVFADAGKRRELEVLALGHVVPKLEALLEKPRLVLEFPLLFEMPGWSGRFDYVLALGCDEDTQRERVMARDGISAEKFERIRASQLSGRAKANLADDYVDTGVSKEDTERQLRTLLPRIQERALQARFSAEFDNAALWERVSQWWDCDAVMSPGLGRLAALLDKADACAQTPHAGAVRLALWFAASATGTVETGLGVTYAVRAMSQSLRTCAADWLRHDTKGDFSLAAELLLACAGEPSAYLRAEPSRMNALAVLQDVLGLRPTRPTVAGLASAAA